MTYCFKCPVCGYRIEQSVPHPEPECNHGDVTDTFETMIRDYRAENAQVVTEVFRSDHL